MTKLSILPLLFVVCALYVNGVKSVYFTKPFFRFGLLPESLDNIVGQVVALPNSTDGCQKGNVIYKISQPNKFSVTTSGWIRVLKETNPENGYNVIVWAGCSKDDLASNVSVQFLPQSKCAYNNDETIQKYARNVCFQDNENRFNIEENTISELGRISPCFKTEPFVKREFDIVKGQDVKDIVSIHKETGEIILIKSIDREKNASITFMVNCRLTINGTHVESTSSKVVIDVIDLNDNPPFFSLNNRRKLLIEWKDGHKNPMQIMLYDKDIVNCNDHKVEIINNGYPVCSLQRSMAVHKDEQCIKGLRILVDKRNIPEKKYYSCKIYITDPMYSSLYNKPVDLTELEIELRNEDKKTKQASFNGVQTSINRHASAFSRVVQLYKHGQKGNFYLKHPIFNVTKNDGIVYVDNATNLNTNNDSDITLNVLDRNNNKSVSVLVFITGSVEEYDDTCELTCARSKDSLSCIESCGLGSMTGKCNWRRNSNDVGKMSKDYETCTPNVATCPDFKCDELERLFPLLCPQDCSVKRHGAYLPNGKYGILKGKSPCWCDYASRCTCLDNPAPDTPNPSLLSDVNIHINYSLYTTKPGQNNSSTKDSMLINIPKVGAQHSKHESCGEDCRTTIAATVGCLGAVVCIVILTWRLRRRHCKSGHVLKHVGSVVSMSAVPSDYFDDRDYRTTHSSSSPQWSPKRQPQYYPTPEDKKWEFQRDKIDLVKTLGEGEFGRVVQAKYYDDDNRESFKFIAIKMLKTGCASTSEEQDLWSEFNLLKDVNHPNVVRLLGACINGGPFYLIVEYCEKGSLLHYLRNSRLEENGYVNNRFRHRLVRQEGQKLDHTDSDLLTTRDLLSFAWQIAKGMQYLSEIKLVHRDLAARNVLVASNKVLKISDFGLTRDVYEADTYLKRSKGRIPVKWLAPESLFAQIYTTQSDVWSYGIVLWEIVTLGAPPYPGIPPERLYNLLMAGYRMDRPEMCSDELYAVMQKCWKADAQDRPIFADLANIFDRMLEQKTEYLDLSNGFEDVTSEVYDRCFGTSFSAPTSSDNQPPKPVRLANDKYGSIVSSDSYLTPSNSRDRLQQSCTDETNVMLDSSDGVTNDVTNTPSSEQDKLCMSVEKCFVAFTNSPDEDIESDETDLLHAKRV